MLAGRVVVSYSQFGSGAVSIAQASIHFDWIRHGGHGTCPVGVRFLDFGLEDFAEHRSSIDREIPRVSEASARGSHVELDGLDYGIGLDDIRSARS